MAKKKPKSNQQLDLTDVDFESAINELTAIVGDLEDGQLGLSGSLSRYEHGVQYLKRCFELLERAEQRISLLTGLDADGNPITEHYDDEEMGLEEKAKSRSKRRSMSRRDATKKKPDAGNVDVPGELF